MSLDSSLSDDSTNTLHLQDNNFNLSVVLWHICLLMGSDLIQAFSRSIFNNPGIYANNKHSKYVFMPLFNNLQVTWKICSFLTNCQLFILYVYWLLRTCLSSFFFGCEDINKHWCAISNKTATRCLSCLRFHTRGLANSGGIDPHALWAAKWQNTVKMMMVWWGKRSVDFEVGVFFLWWSLVSLFQISALMGSFRAGLSTEKTFLYGLIYFVRCQCHFLLYNLINNYLM